MDGSQKPLWVELCYPIAIASTSAFGAQQNLLSPERTSAHGHRTAVRANAAWRQGLPPFQTFIRLVSDHSPQPLGTASDFIRPHVDDLLKD
jgi:hypothetical protein